MAAIRRRNLKSNTGATHCKLKFMRIPAMLLLSACAISAADLDKEGARWWSHVSVLADDKMEGRNAGSAGHRRAAEFLAGEFERAGLKPAGINGYLQPVPLKVAQIVEEQSSLAIIRNGQVTPLKLGEEAMLGARPGLAGHVDAELIFCGYGLSIPEFKYDDFAGQNLRGKVIVYINGGPSEVPGALRSHYSSREERWKPAQRAGVIGVIAIPNPKSMDIPWERAALSRLNATMTLADDRLGETPGQQLAVTFNPAYGDKLLAGSGHTMSELLALADEGKPLPRFPLNLSLRATLRMKESEVESQNVIAMLPGSDPKLKDEYVVFGGHLDHLGTGAAVGGDSIYNGAMDDGSGIASLIEIATLAKQEKLRFRRSVLFVAVTGEEKGLLGSRFFTHNPTVPLDKIVADINMDMYLPLYPLKYLEVQGLGESTLGAEIRAAAEKSGVLVQADKEPERNLFIRSDQYNFIKSGIPALAFKFGWDEGSPEEKLAKDWLRDRYHAPSDDLSQPVDKAAAAKFNRIMLELGARVANADARPRWNEDSFFRRFAR
jgi:hypothetical protein